MPTLLLHPSQRIKTEQPAVSAFTSPPAKERRDHGPSQREQSPTGGGGSVGLGPHTSTNGVKPRRILLRERVMRLEERVEDLEEFIRLSGRF